MALPLIRVGCSIPNQAFTPGKTPPWYDANQPNQDAGDALFCTLAGRSLNGTGWLAVTKKFWNEGTYTLTQSKPAGNNLVQYQAHGTRVIVCLWPTLSRGLAAGSNFGTAGTSAQQANSLAEYNPATNTGKMVVFLQQLVAWGFTTDTCRIVLVQEPCNSNKNISPVDYANMFRTYGPAVNDVRNGPGGTAAFPLIANVNFASGLTGGTDYARAALGVGTPYSSFPTGCTFLGVAIDYYTNHYYGGHNFRFDTQDSAGYSVSGIADSLGIGFGVHEIGCPPAQIDPSGPPYPLCTAYMQYILSFMKARQNAGKPCLDVIYYNGQGPPTGIGDITSPIGQDPFVTPSGSADFRAKLFQNIFDGLATSSPSFTLRQTSQNFAAAGGTGVLSMWNNQAVPPSPSAATLNGSLLVAKIELNDCQLSTTVTGPAGWVQAQGSKSGTANGNCRVQIWYYPNSPGGLYGTSGALATWTCSNTGATVKGAISEWTTAAATVQAVDQTGFAGAVAPVTSMPVSCSAANIFTGDMATVMIGATLSGGATGQTWTTPGGWTTDGTAQNATNVFDRLSQPSTAAGTTSVTGLITLGGLWTMTSWAAAAATFYAAAALPLADTTGALPSGTAGTAYSVPMSADGGAGPYTFTLASGTLPTGVTLAAGVLAGTPTVAGSYTFHITAADCSQQSVNTPYTVIVAPSGGTTLAIGTTSLPGGTTGVPYTAALSASGGTPPYTWTVT